MRALLALIALGLVMGCGVRGRPLPPEKPALMGRGAPEVGPLPTNKKLSPNQDPSTETSTERR